MQQSQWGCAGWKAGVQGLLGGMLLVLSQNAWAGPRSLDALIRDTLVHVEQSQAKRHGKFATEEPLPDVAALPVHQGAPVFEAPSTAWMPPLSEAYQPLPKDISTETIEEVATLARDDASLNVPVTHTVLPPIETRVEPVEAHGAPSTPLYVGAGSPVFPEGIHYVLQGQSHLAYQSNPYRLSDAQSVQIQGDLALHNEVRAAATVPLLSERTLAYGSVALGDVSYQKESRLNHQPHHLSAGVRVRAGDWWQGGLEVSDQKRLYRYLGRSWPERDMVSQREWSGRVGVRLTEKLTLPEVEFMQRQVRYDLLGNQQLYNHDLQQMRVYATLAGVDDSYVRLGTGYGTTDYLDRLPALAALVGKRYNEKEVLLQWRWRHSVKTVVDGHLGWRARHYPELPQRDLNFAFMDLNLGWTYSPKTQFWLNLWNLPYGNEENPFYLYSTLRGARASVQWAHSPYVWSSINVVREMQVNHAVSPSGQDAFHSWRFGPRFEWQFHRNMKFFADAWYERNFKGASGQNLNSHVIRAGLVINLDNGNKETQKLFRHAECAPPRYIEMSECLP